MMFSLGVTASAAPTDAFSHDDTVSGTTETTLSQDIYTATKLIDAHSLGLKKSLDGVNDFCADKDGKVYLLVSENSEIVILKPDYTLDRVLKIKDKDGTECEFQGARGIFVDEDNKIYVCDTNNLRILICDQSGKVTKTLTKPDSQLYPPDEELPYQPSKVTKTSKGYTYVLILGGYYGALLYSPDDEFLGFYGANTVQASALDTLNFLWNRLTQTDAKKAASAKKLPYSFVDLCMDKDDYILTCTEASPEEKGNGTGQLRKLSPTGENIMFKRLTDGTSTSASSINFVETELKKQNGYDVKQNIISIDVDDNDFIYALDGTLGLIYVYDDECNLIGGFAGGFAGAKTLGTLGNPNSIGVFGSDVLVSDIGGKNITVYERTEYGNLVMNAQRAYLDGEYEKAKPLWEEVNKRDKSCQLAYRGLAIAYLSEGDHHKALEYAEKGFDYTVYDLAYKAVRNEFILNNFLWIFILVLLLAGGLIAFSVIVKRKQIVLIKNHSVKLALSSTVHPFKVFEEIKYKKNGSYAISAVILALYYLANVYKAVGSGFLASKVNVNTYNTLYTLVESVGIIILWVICNWLVTSSFEGKGSFKEVLVATTYSLIPLTIFTFIQTILSNVLSITGLGIMNVIGTVVLILTFILLCVSIMAMHEYDFFKFLLTSIVTILFMILVTFVIFVVFVLLQQVWGFFASIFTEIFYR